MRLEDILKREEGAVFRLRELYRCYGYTQYKMSKFEPYDLYVRNKSFLISENILTFTDTDGRLMALKPDVTLSIIKNTREDAGALQKVYYHENVYRTSPASHGFREIMQAGLECVGELDLVALGEVLSLAAQSLETVGGGEYLLDLSHLGFVSGLLDSAGVPEEARRELLTRMGEKNVPALTAGCAALGLEAGVTEDLCRLTALYGPPAVLLPSLGAMVRGERMAAALAELEAVCGLLADYGDRLRLDFSIVNDMNYYNGLIFRGYLPGLPSGVLAGGQYDNLLRQMGRRDGAIGFAVYLDQLERLEAPSPAYDADLLLLYGEHTPPAAVARAAEDCRRSGRSVRVERREPRGLRFRDIQEVR